LRLFCPSDCGVFVRFSKFVWFDTLYCLALSLYILAGVELVPFHGDESTVIYMARDFYYIFVQGDVNHVRYTATPEAISSDAATEQELRLLNGTLHRYLYGLTAYSGGYSFDQINTQWDWCCDWQYNADHGHIPAPDLLLRTRFVSAGLTALACMALFGVGYQLGGRPVAYLAALYFALNPAVLINGRRAMMEGGMLAFSLLTLLAGMWVMQAVQRQTTGRGTLPPYIALGIFAGLAVAAKHTSAFTVAAVFGACSSYALLHFWRTRYSASLRHIIYLLGACILAFGVFYALNPAWWDDITGSVGRVWTLRNQLLDGQAATFGGYPDFGAKIAGGLRQLLIVPPQYFEVSNWQGFIADQIATYENSIWRGISVGGSLLGAVLLVGCILAGMVALWRDQRISNGLRWLLAIYSLAMLALTLLLTPLEWQRYTLPAYPVVALFAALGIVQIYRWLRSILYPSSALS
jgi:4-amino-4-deoxy-L-arabinose transferase-like glycosyltransferase